MLFVKREEQAFPEFPLLFSTIFGEKIPTIATRGLHITVLEITAPPYYLLLNTEFV